MDKFIKLIELTKDNRVELAASFKDVLHKKLVLGQSRYVCRFGTLSDGHEKITPSQRYFQAIKEMYYLGVNIQAQRSLAKRAQADLMDAQERLALAKKPSETLRAEADCEDANNRIMQCLVMVEDQMRMLDEYNIIRAELEPTVEAQYPGGIEEAERDNWEAVYRYRMEKERVPGMGREITSNVPLDPVTKASLGLEYGRMDSIAPLKVSDPQACQALENKFEHYLKLTDQSNFAHIKTLVTEKKEA